MKSGLGELASKFDSKGSSARLKILSKKAGLYGDSPSKNMDPVASPSSKNLKTFRINQPKQNSQLKLNESKNRLDSRKDSQPSEFLERNSSGASPHGKDLFYSSRRQSGFPNYILGYSPRA